MTDVITEMGAGSLDFVRAGDADARTAERFRREVRQWLRRSFALGEDRIADIVLAVYEALANAAEFAYLAAPGDGTMRLAGHHDPSTGRLVMTVADRGVWRHNDSRRPRRRGRGIALMEGLADHAVIDRRASGTVVKLRFDGIGTTASRDPAGGLDESKRSGAEATRVSSMGRRGYPASTSVRTEFVDAEKGRIMSASDKIANKVDDLAGKAKEGLGKAAGDKRTANEGKLDQAKASVKDAGEKVKDALKGK